MENANAITKEAFIALSEKEKLTLIEQLNTLEDYEKIIDLLLALGLEALTNPLLSELARAYNNTYQIELAMMILKMIPQKARDALWYYRLGYSHTVLAEDLSYDFTSEATHALDMLEKATLLATEASIISWCIELLSFTKDLAKLLEEKKENYPQLYSHYLTSQDKNFPQEESAVKNRRNKVYRKITLADIANAEDSWELAQPMYWTINLYESYNDYLTSSETFTLEQRYLYAITWYFIEVNNGGHHQFFFNSTGIVWEDALKGFVHFGMLDYHKNFKRLVDYFGGTIAFDRQTRWQMLKTYENKDEQTFYALLDEVDNFVYDYDGLDNELNYILKNPEKFTFEGYYEEY